MAGYGTALKAGCAGDEDGGHEVVIVWDGLLGSGGGGDYSVKDMSWD